MSDFSVGGRGAGLACSRASSLVKNAVSTLVPERWDARLATERCEGVTERAGVGGAAAGAWAEEGPGPMPRSWMILSSDDRRCDLPLVSCSTLGHHSMDTAVLEPVLSDWRTPTPSLLIRLRQWASRASGSYATLPYSVTSPLLTFWLLGMFRARLVRALATLLKLGGFHLSERVRRGVDVTAQATGTCVSTLEQSHRLALHAP